MKEVKIKFNKKTGEIKVETDGFQGESCMDIDRLIGDVLKDSKVETTDEFFYDDETNINQIN